MAFEERVRVAAPDGRVAEVDGVTGRRYKATGGGMYDMHPRDAKALLREGGFVPSIGGVTCGGYICPCGFRPVVRTCSRCGGRAETASERADRLAAREVSVEVVGTITKSHVDVNGVRVIDEIDLHVGRPIFGPEHDMARMVRQVRDQSMRALRDGMRAQ